MRRAAGPQLADREPWSRNVTAREGRFWPVVPGQILGLRKDGRPIRLIAGGSGPAVVQTAKNSGTGTSLTVTLSSGTTAGNCLFVLVLTAANTNGSVSGITLGGSAGNFGSVASEGNSGDHAIATCWADPNCAGGQTSIVISTTGSSGTQAIIAIVYEVSGMPSAIAGMLDKSAVLSSSGFVTSWTLGPTATTTQASELWLSIAGGNVSAATAGTYTGPGTAWTNTALNGVNNYTGTFSAGGVSGFQVVSATGTASYNGTASPTSTIEGLVVALKAATTSMTQGTATLAGQGSVSTAATTRAPATLAGQGSITATDTQGAGGTLTGQGALSAPGTTAAPATLTGQGSITAAATEQAGTTLAGHGQVSTSATEQSGGTMAGQGSLGPPAVTEAAPATLTGHGQLAATATTTAPATLTGQGQVSAATVPQGGGTLTGSGSLDVPATTAAPATLTGQGQVSGTGSAPGGGGATLTGGGSLGAPAGQAAGTAIAGHGSISASGQVITPGGLPPLPDGVTAGPPYGRWSAGEPDTAWSAGLPEARFSAGTPHG